MLRILIVIAALAFTGVPASAQTGEVRDRIVEQLQDAGYSRIMISRTWLGRLRFVATDDRRRREIVVAPATGEILRDYFELLERERRRNEDEDGDSGSLAQGTGNDDFEDDEDSVDDDDDRDEEDEEDEQDEEDEEDEEDDDEEDDDD